MNDHSASFDIAQTRIVPQAFPVVDTAAQSQLAQSVARLTQASEMVRALGAQSRDVAGWVHSVSDSSQTATATMQAVKDRSLQIACFAMELNILAKNANADSQLAVSGLGGLVQAIHELSQHTRDAAEQISDQIERLALWVDDLGHEARDVALTASAILSHSDAADLALARASGADDI